MNNRKIITLLFCSIHFLGFSQTDIDHWESAIVAEDIWRFRPGNTEAPIGWQNPGFDDTWWGEGAGGIGYGDLDDNTVIAETWSVYLRKEFQVIDTSKIELATLYADYDDAFVAYLNGVEIARANIGSPGELNPYNQPANTDHEAQLYQGGLPEAFLIEKNTLNQLLINGTNTLAIQVHNKSNTSSDLSSNFYLLFGINDASNDYAPLPDWYTQLFVSSNLPLLLINTSGQSIPDDPKIEAHLGIIDNGQIERNYLTDAFNGYDGKIGIEIRGSSSQMFPKKNYSLETRNEDGSNNNVPLLGLPHENDWVLHGPYSDKSLMRNVLSYYIGWQTDRYAPRTRWCELFINGQYHGVYVLTEKIKRDANRVNIDKLLPVDISGDELTGGYIFSGDRDDEGPTSGWSSPYTNNVFYKYQDPDKDELVAEQKAYISNYILEFEEVMAGPASSALYDQYINVDSWVDYWIATEIFKHIDGFKFSFYMYKKKDSNGGKIHFGPLWDLNLAMGNFTFWQDPSPQGWSYVWASSGSLRPFWILELLDIPDVQNQINCRWHELRQGALATGTLLQFIDENALLIEEARVRNFERWEILGQYIWPNDFVGTDYNEELDYLKNWLIDRLAWMDDNMVGEECATVSSENLKKQNKGLIVYPNPAENTLIFKTEKPIRSIIIYNQFGNIVLAKTNLTEIDLKNLMPAMYFLDIELQSGKRVRKKVIKN